MRAASVNSVGAAGLDAGGSIRAAPSSSEYSEWTWRWTKPCSDIVAGRSPSAPGCPQSGPEPVETYTPVIRGSPNATPGSRRRQGCRSRAGARERLGQIGRQRLLELERFAGERMVERQPPGVQERARRDRACGPRPRRRRRARSPTIGCPIAARWTRIWWVRPVRARPRAASLRAEPLADRRTRSRRRALRPVDDDAGGAPAERRLDAEVVVLGAAARRARGSGGRPRGGGTSPAALRRPDRSRRPPSEPARPGVEPVDDARAAAAPRRVRAAPPCRAAGSRACPPMRGGRVGHARPAGFDDDDEMRRPGSGPEPGPPAAQRWRRGSASSTSSRLAAGQSERLRPRGAVDRDAPARDRALDVGARGAGQRRHDGVEPAGRRDEPAQRIAGRRLREPRRAAAPSRHGQNHEQEGADHDRRRRPRLNTGQTCEDRRSRRPRRTARTADDRSIRLPERAAEDQPERDGLQDRSRAERRSPTITTTHGDRGGREEPRGPVAEDAEGAPGVRREPETAATPAITSRGWSAQRPLRPDLVSRSRTSTIPAVAQRMRPPRRRAASTGALPARLRLCVLDAQIDVRERLDPRLLDRLAASFADPVRAGVDPLRAPDRSSASGRARSARSRDPSRARTSRCRHRPTRRRGPRRRTGRTGSRRTTCPRSSSSCVLELHRARLAGAVRSSPISFFVSLAAAMVGEG